MRNIQRHIVRKVKVDLNSNRLGALASSIYNCDFKVLGNSTIINKINERDFIGAANQFLCGNKADRGGYLMTLKGSIEKRYA